MTDWKQSAIAASQREAMAVVERNRWRFVAGVLLAVNILLALEVFQ